YVGGRSLLLERFTELARARLHLVEQPHVLDRNHRLVGKSGHQLDLFVGERPHFTHGEDDDPKELALPEHRNSQQGPIDVWRIIRMRGISSIRVLGISSHIFDMNRPTLESGARSGGVPSGSKRSAREELSALRGHIESSDQIKELTIEAEDECLIRLAEPRRRLDERIEHSLQVEGGVADYLEHVGGGGLLLQRLAQLIE